MSKSTKKSNSAKGMNQEECIKVIVGIARAGNLVEEAIDSLQTLLNNADKVTNPLPKKAPLKRGKSMVNTPSDAPTKSARPTSSFFFWSKDNRERIKKENPEAKTVPEVSKICGAEWKQLTSSTKSSDKKIVEKYTDLAKADADRVMKINLRNGTLSKDAIKRLGGAAAVKSAQENMSDDSGDDSTPPTSSKKRISSSKSSKKDDSDDDSTPPTASKKRQTSKSSKKNDSDDEAPAPSTKKRLTKTLKKVESSDDDISDLSSDDEPVKTKTKSKTAPASKTTKKKAPQSSEDELSDSD